MRFTNIKTEFLTIFLITNNAIYSQDGNSLHLDGSDDYITVAANDAFNFTDDAFTLETYINREVSGTDDCIIGKDHWFNETG